MVDTDDSFLELFKYRSLAGEFGRPTAEDILLRNRMHWQSPSTFNDPFDCNPVFVFGTTALSREAFARRAARNNTTARNRQERRKAKKTLASRPKRANEELLRSGFLQWMRESGVSCFSKVNDCPLMWAHYAESHRGACFVFQEQRFPTLFMGFDVEYSEARPLVDATRARDADVFKLAVLTKSDRWAYEQEVRMVDYRTGAGPRSFPRKALRGVIYGARISDEDRRFLDHLVDQRGDGLQRYQAQVDDRLFRINIAPIE